MRTFDTPSVLGVLNTHQVFWGCSEHTRCSGHRRGARHARAHGARITGTETLGVLAVFWRCSGHSRGVLGTDQVFWRCSGHAPGVLEVFWARTRCSGGVLGTGSSMGAGTGCSKLYVHVVDECGWTQGAHGRLDTSGISHGLWSW